MKYRGSTVRQHVSFPSGLRLDAVVAALAWLMVAGVAADFRRHAEGISFAEEGFLTPEHVFFYSMFLAIAAVVGAVSYRGRREGAAWTDAVPDGYRWAVVGVALFGFGGVGDFFWHSAFGFEEGVEALTSPSHLALAIGGVLFLSGPLRAALVRAERPGNRAAIPAILSASLTLTVIVLIGGYLNPIYDPGLLPIHEGMSDALIVNGLVGVLAFPAMLVGTILVVDRAVDLPPGGVTLLAFHPGLASVLVLHRLELLLPVLAAGLVGDAVLLRGSPLRAHPRALRAVGALVPLTFAASYFLLLEVLDGVTWTIHVWAGTVVLAGAAGLLTTYAVLPISPAATRGELQ